jgi:predicted transcriptional regulator
MLNTINDRGTEGASRTMIMYNCFPSYAQLQEYLSFLVERCVVDELPLQYKNGRHYKVTQKGYRLLQISQGIEKYIQIQPVFAVTN